MAEFNSMQANLGLIPGVGGPPSGIQSPANVATQLSQQASQQLQQAQQQVPVAMGGGAAFSFGQQFQQQLHQIQSQQSMNIYQAAMMAGNMPGGGMMPSPLTMTPPSTGIFRPPAQAPSFAPIAPTPVMPMAQTPFQPQMPAPMFQTAWEQEVQQRDLRADKLYSYAAQAPRALGQGAGIGMGALAGGILGSRFGGVGRAVGALAGAGIAQMSGAAPAMGEMAMMPMRPNIQQHQMGASLQRMSQDWVVGGSQLHATGRGFNRGASLELAGGLQQMAGSASFQQETGGMFNRQDLMQMTQQAGQRGLLDEEQSISGVKQQMRRVSQVVRRFMELTNDPDVTNVIRQMGQMRQMGLTVPDMENAATNMRQFSRAAGTTISGMMQTYGMPGAATYQQAGLSAGAGMNYGMYAGASARQAVASQTFSPMQLSMLGGTQGVAQRNMQAQAAMMSMPVMGAAMGGFQGGQWGMDAGATAGLMGGNVGAGDVVRGAIGNIGRAVDQGGIGALAMFPLQQRMIQSQAAGSMSPYQQTAMRFQMAQRTGEQLGMTGAGAFAVGSQAMFGKEVAEQMMIEASNPEYWRSQRAMIRREQDELARTQRQEIKENAPGFFMSLVGGPMGSISRWAAEATDPVSGSARAIGRGVSSAYEAFSDYKEDIAAKGAGKLIQRTDKRFTTESVQARKAQAYRAKGLTRDQLNNVLGTAKGGVDYGQFFEDATKQFEGTSLSQYGGISEGVEWAAQAVNFVPVIGPAIAIASYLTDVDTGELAKSGLGALMYNTMPPEAREAINKKASKDAATTRKMIRGSESYSATSEASKASYSDLEKDFGLNVSGYSVMSQAGGKLARVAEGAQGVEGANKSITADAAEAAVVSAIVQNSGESRAVVQAKYDKLSTDKKEAYRAMAFGDAFNKTTDAGKAMMLETTEKFMGGEGRRKLADMKKLVSGAKETLEELESTMDFNDDLGNAKAGRDEIREIAKTATRSEMMMMVRNEVSGETAAGMEAGIRKEIAEREGLEYDENDTPEESARKKKLLDSRYTEMTQRVESGRLRFGKGKMITDDARARVRGAIKAAGGDANKVYEQMIKMSDETTGTIQGLQIGKAGGRLEDVLNTGVDLQNLLSISEDNIIKMRNTEFSDVAATLDRARKASTPGERKRLEEEAFGQLAAKGAGITSKEEIDLYQARGDKARQGRADMKTVADAEGQFAEVFKNFKGSTKSFKEGAEALQNAMNTGTLRMVARDTEEEEVL